MYGTFATCALLPTVPAIPKNVMNMVFTFEDCKNLTGEIEINANPTSYDSCFKYTEKEITLIGAASTETKANLITTCTNGNVNLPE